MEIADESMEVDDAHSRKEVSRCLQIGLLCVQEQAIKRPTMSSVVFMLGNDAVLPSPNQPAYIIRRDDIMSGNTIGVGPASLNDVTISLIEEGR